MKDNYTNWLGMVATIKRLPPNRRLDLCTDFTERVIRIYDNYANADVDAPVAYFSDMRDLVLELRREV